MTTRLPCKLWGIAALALMGLVARTASMLRGQEPLNRPPPGYTALFDGKSLDGWKGLVENPVVRAGMSREQLAAAQKVADERMRAHWKPADGVLVFDGKGDSICTTGDYEDFELLVDWKIRDKGDSGLYLRGSPQVQIWDPAQRPEGSGGLFNNLRYPSRPLIRADRAVGEWNRFRVFMVGEFVTVYLNDILVVDQVPLENYWDRGKAIFPSGQIELQNHGNTLYFRNVFAREIPRPAGSYARHELVLERGDRVAIVGDSITEQKRYSRFIEDYLLACVPQLDLRVIQLGWSGERAPGFQARMDNDLMPFEPDVVTTCYGMNDGSYRAYQPEIGATYETSMRDIVTRLKKAGVTVIVGSPGAVDTFTFRRRGLEAKVYNHNLAQLRDIARDLAYSEGMPFANVFDVMDVAMRKAKPVLGDQYHVCGSDGFHPAENGHLVMAYAFLKSLGLDGEIGRITVDRKGGATATDGHEVVEAAGNAVVVESSRYPFCFTGDARSPSSTRSILPYVPFNRDLNRLTLLVKNLESASVEVRWGEESKVFTRKRLEAGINLAAEFLDNPFSASFARVDGLVAKKQAYETPMIKNVVTRFRSTRAQVTRLLGDDNGVGESLAGIRRRLMEKHGALHREVRAAIRPVRHTITITPR